MSAQGIRPPRHADASHVSAAESVIHTRFAISVVGWPIYVLDDPALSVRVRSVLAPVSRRMPSMAVADVRAIAVLRTDGGVEAAPALLIESMIWFESRYGGLWYPVVGPNDMEYGLDGDPVGHRGPLGLAFTGIIDGDWTWGVDMLTDGRTAMGPGTWAYRVIDRSIDQRLESHALLLTVRGWYHRTFTSTTPRDVLPVADERHLPDPVPEATGPTQQWWFDEDAGTAVQAELRAWPDDRDEWTVRSFARAPVQVADANTSVFAATGHETVPATWCTLCSHAVSAGRTCVPGRS
jgi:hypothetical protein